MQSVASYSAIRHGAIGADPVDFLNRKSEVNKRRAVEPRIADVLVIEDNTFDAATIAALLRAVIGHDVAVRQARSMMRATTLMLERQPQLILLDDILPPVDRALRSLPLLRRQGFAGPIVVVSGEVTRTHRLALLATGASDVVHKDDLGAVELGEVLARLGAIGSSQAGPMGTGA